MYNLQYYQTNFILIDNLYVSHTKTWHLEELFILQIKSLIKCSYNCDFYFASSYSSTFSEARGKKS